MARKVTNRNTRSKTPPTERLTFSSVKKRDVPHVRKGKHHDLVADVLRDLDKISSGAALKVPKTALGDAKLTNFRAALNRASSRAGISLGTTSDENYLYIWRLE